MKLHRLVLTNYRGITHREIEFPDHGVVVVSGANEIGKSSMIEALDLLLHSKDRSTKKDVKQVKPTHADVGAEITAEISTGPYRFTYHKRFHKRCETQLTVLTPRREQLTGDEAHERVLTILDETVDMDLWQAQRVLQAASTAAVDLSGCDALSRALDVAAGEAVQLSGAEPLLVDRIDAEYLRYFTPTGRPTGEWAAATNRLRAADDEVARCAAAVAEVDDAVRRHAALTLDLGRLADERADASKRLATARAAADAVAALTPAAQRGRGGRRRRGCHARRIDGGAHRTPAVACGHRRTDCGDRQIWKPRRRRRSRSRRPPARCRKQPRPPPRPRGRRCRPARPASTRPAAPSSSSRTATKADRLAARLTKIDVAQRELERIDRGLSGIALTDALMRTIEDAATAVELAAGQVELTSAHIELVAVADVEILLDGESIALDAGATWSTSASAPTDIELPGLLIARVVPGTPASDTQAKLDAAQEVLAGGAGQGSRRRCRGRARPRRTAPRVDQPPATGFAPGWRR